VLIASDGERVNNLLKRKDLSSCWESRGGKGFSIRVSKGKCPTKKRTTVHYHLIKVRFRNPYINEQASEMDLKGFSLKAATLRWKS